VDPGIRQLADAVEAIFERVNTPVVLRLAVAFTIVAVTFFVSSVHLGVGRIKGTVKTVGQEATQGITAAQRIKLGLTELDELVAEDELGQVPAGPSGFPDNYDAKRGQLESDLVAAAAKTPPGAAYLQPLANIDYALGHYHALVKDSFAARTHHDPQTASLLYGQAHAVMDGTLLAQADSFDKANTYVLNSSYRSHKADAAKSVRLILVSWLVLLGVLVVLQLYLLVRFRRLVNIALAASLAMAGLSGLYVLVQLNSSSTNLTTAREHAFDPVHELARARATVVAAREAEGLMLLDPGNVSIAQAGFTEDLDKLFRVQGSTQVEAIARSGRVVDGAGGYLATVIHAAVSQQGTAAAQEALVAFGVFSADHSTLRARLAAGDLSTAQATFRSARTFSQLTGAIDRAEAVDQATFDSHAAAASRAIRHIDLVNLLSGAAILILGLLGLNQRLGEYRG